VNESYTSKTCGKCGEINNKLGSQSIFKCKTCKIEIDRDINAARNICIKNSVLL
jgi:putative transposase